MSNKHYYFDRTAQFNRDILPLVEELAKRCRELGIPNALAFQMSSLESGDDIFAGATLSDVNNQRMDCAPTLLAINSVINCMRLVSLPNPSSTTVDFISQNPLLVGCINERVQFRANKDKH